MKAKYDLIWNEQLGNYKFKELFGILERQNLPLRTRLMEWQQSQPPDRNLLDLFYLFSTAINSGVTLDYPSDDGGYLFGIFCPKMMSYGLVDKIETKNEQLNLMEVKYQTSELGYKFFSLLEKIDFRSQFAERLRLEEQEIYAHHKIEKQKDSPRK